MPTQAHLIVGVPITSIDDLKRIGQHFKLPHLNLNSLDDWIEAFQDNPKYLNLEGTEFYVSITVDDREDVELPPHTTKNSMTGETGNSYLCVGACITSRYLPALADKGWDRGRPEPFKLDLERLQKIREDARRQWPEAEVLMMDFNH